MASPLLYSALASAHCVFMDSNADLAPSNSSLLRPQGSRFAFDSVSTRTWMSLTIFCTSALRPSHSVLAAASADRACALLAATALLSEPTAFSSCGVPASTLS
jgi:hypothetical protein